MRKYYPTLIRVLFCVFISIFAQRASAQYQYPRYISTGPNSGGYYEYIPAGYNAYRNTKKYPLLVFLHGAGQFGNGDSAELPRIKATAIPHLIAEHAWPDSFTVNGNTYQFIVISPQFAVWPSDDDVNDVVQYAMTHYRVDTGRVYLTGLSMGGLATWSYASFPQWAGLLAAIVPTSADTNFHGLAGAKVMAENNLPIFATHNRYDTYLPCSGDIYNINLVNDSVNPPIHPTAQLRIFNAYGHDSWDSTYNPKTIMYQGLNIYQWMLLYSRDPGGNTPPPPIPNGFMTFTAVPIGSQTQEVQLSWSDSSEQDNRYFVVQRSTDSIQFSTIDTVSAVPGMITGNSYSFIDPSPPSGRDYYRLFQVHLDGTASISPVRKVIIGQGSGVTPTKTIGLWLSPNPATSALYVTIGGSVSESLELRLVDLRGNILRTWLFQKTDNNWIQLVDIGDLVPGTYFIQAFGKNWHSARAFIKR